jgi:hypothetical protein
MRGWHPIIVISNVVPERSGPITKIGFSVKQIAIVSPEKLPPSISLKITFGDFHYERLKVLTMKQNKQNLPKVTNSQVICELISLLGKKH